MAFKCNLCPGSFGLHKHLTRHIEAKHGSINFKCNVCQFSTNRKDNLKRHKMSKHTESTVNNHNEVDKILKCPQYELPASSQSNLNRHIRLKHPSDKKFIKCIFYILPIQWHILIYIHINPAFYSFRLWSNVLLCFSFVQSFMFKKVIRSRKCFPTLFTNELVITWMFKPNMSI